MKSFSLFGPSDEDIENEIEKRYEHEFRKNQQDYDIRLERIKHQHDLTLKEKEFEIKHFKDTEIKKLEKELAEAQVQVEVLKKEREMLNKIIESNIEYVNVQEMVEKLIEKLPTVDVNAIAVNSKQDEE